MKFLRYFVLIAVFLIQLVGVLVAREQIGLVFGSEFDDNFDVLNLYSFEIQSGFMPLKKDFKFGQKSHMTSRWCYISAKDANLIAFLLRYHSLCF